MPDLFRPSGHTILIIEDETDILDLVSYNLEREGYRVLKAPTGEQGLRLVRTEKPSLIVLDLMLPDIPGLEICRHLSQDPATSSIPVIMLTARGAEADRISGFESGAEDYLTKPFSVRELLLRIRARLRAPRPPGGPEDSHESELRSGAVEMFPALHKVFVSGKEVGLSLLEFKLLLHLLRTRERVQSREMLLDQVWGMSANVTTRTVDTHVKRLRDKLGKAGAQIETIRGIGYKWAE